MKMKVQNSHSLFLIFTFLCVLGNYAEAIASATENNGTLHDDGQINWDEQSRIYYYYEPSDPGPSSRPLVILLHGGSINIKRLLGLERRDQIAPSKLWFNIADEEKLYLAIPQGYQNHWNDYVEQVELLLLCKFASFFNSFFPLFHPHLYYFRFNFFHLCSYGCHI